MQTYSYLGAMSESHLKLDIKSESQNVNSKGSPWWKLNSFHVSKSILCNLYHSFIKSRFLSSAGFIACQWRIRIALNSSIVKVCSKIAGVHLTDLSSLRDKTSSPESSTGHESSRPCFRSGILCDAFGMELPRPQQKQIHCIFCYSFCHQALKCCWRRQELGLKSVSGNFIYVFPWMIGLVLSFMWVEIQTELLYGDK